MQAVLNSGVSVSAVKPLIETKVPSLNPDQIILFGCGLKKQQLEQLTTLTQQFRLKMMMSYS
jgi:hypothetical protein